MTSSLPHTPCPTPTHPCRQHRCKAARQQTDSSARLYACMRRKRSHACASAHCRRMRHACRVLREACDRQRGVWGAQVPLPLPSHVPWHPPFAPRGSRPASRSNCAMGFPSPHTALPRVKGAPKNLRLCAVVQSTFNRNETGLHEDDRRSFGCAFYCSWLPLCGDARGCGAHSAHEQRTVTLYAAATPHGSTVQCPVPNACACAIRHV